MNSDGKFVGPAADHSDPMHVVILVLPDSTMMTVASVFDPLRAANRIAHREMFSWQMVTPDGKPVRLSGGFELAADDSFANAAKAELLIVVASFNHEKHASRELIATLRGAHHRYNATCGVEAGTWLLARAGLVTHEKITTHWEDLEPLAQRFPELEVVRNRYIKAGKLWSCGGASPALDMMLDLIREKGGASLALNVASVFIYDQARTGDDEQPNLSLGRLEFLEPRLVEAARIMERTIDQPLSISNIATQVKISVKMLELLWRKHLDESPGRYYLQLRLQAALKMVSDTNLTMQEIAIRTGFNSLSAFSRRFKQHFGKGPLQMRQHRF